MRPMFDGAPPSILVLSAVVSYLGTIDDSNIPLFEYHRNIVSLLLRVAF